MPVFYLGRNRNDGARRHLNGFFAPFLVPTATSDADEYLHLLVVDVPVVAATRFEGDIHHATTNICQIALANEILAVWIRLALWPFAMQGVALTVEPCREFIHQLLTVTHVDGTLLMGCKLWSNSIETAECCYSYYLTVGSRELIASKDVTKEMRLQVVVVLRTEFVIERTT